MRMTAQGRMLQQAVHAPLAHAPASVEAAVAGVGWHRPSAIPGDGLVALSMLNQLSIGVVLVDRAARVLFVNSAAQTLSAAGGPLEVNSKVTAASSEHARSLGDLIRSALGGTEVRSMSLPSSDNGRPLMILVAPVRGDVDRSDIRNLRAAAAMLLICDPCRPALIPPAWIMDAYGLTLAEARVALAVASGGSIPNTARRLKISVNTVKTHLRRVYEKTGTGRQAELSRLMATIGLAQGHASNA